MTRRKGSCDAPAKVPPKGGGVGVDIVETARFLAKKNDTRFLRSIFTESEINYCMRRKHCEQHLAARFACKEAVMKALSSYRISAGPREIEILSEIDGRPTVRIMVPAAKTLDVDVSMSHSREYAVAIAIAASGDRTNP